MPDETTEKWYCLTTQPKREHIAALSIKSRAGIEAFCPRLAYIKKTKRGMVRFVEPLFPNYLFVFCDIQMNLRHLMSMQGVSGVVKYGERIPHLPESFIEEIKPYFTEDIRELETPDLKEGQEVLVTEGPFEDLKAIVERYTPATDRVKVLLDFLGRELSVEIPADSVTQPDFQPKRTIK